MLHDLAESGPDEDEMRRAATPISAGSVDPIALVRSEAVQIARATLLGYDIQRIADVETLRREATSGEVRGAVASFLEKAFVSAPHDVPDLRPRQRIDGAPVAGRAIATGNKGGDGRAKRVAVGADGISAYTGDRWITILWDRLELAQQHPDGHWEFHDRSGVWIDLVGINRRIQARLNRLIGRYLIPDRVLPPSRDARSSGDR